MSDSISPLGNLLERQAVEVRLRQARKVLDSPNSYSAEQLRRATAAVVKYAREEVWH